MTDNASDRSKPKRRKTAAQPTKTGPVATSSPAGLGPTDAAAAPSKPVRKITWQQRLDAFEKHPTVRLVKLLASTFAFLVLVGTAFQLLDDLGAREQDRIDAALTRIQIRSGGNTGKALAINALIDANRPISNLNFSCERIGDWSERDRVCRGRVIFEGLRLEMPRRRLSWFGAKDRLNAFLGQGDETPPLRSINFADGIFEDMTAERIVMENVDFERAVFRGGSVSHSRIEGNFRDASFDGIDLSGAELTGDFSGARFDSTDVSGAAITGLEMAAEISNVFAWLDLPPERYEFERPDGLVNMKDGRTTSYPPQPVEVLKRIIFCAAPMKDGQAMPVERREKLTLDNCARVNTEDALAAIGRQYGAM